MFLTRAEHLIGVINNCDYWEIIAVLTIIVMSIIHVYTKSHQKPDYVNCFDVKCNCHKPKYVDACMTQLATKGSI